VDEYAGRVLADRYRLPRPPADEYELVETRAFDTYSGQEVLVRQVLLPEVVGDDDGYGGHGFGDGPGALGESARRALDAARAAAAVPDHPRLVQVFDIFVEGGSLWIASELVSGRPLAALLAERPLDAYRAAEIAADVLTALRALHADGWTHRNVTASTVLVCDDGRAMLGGLAAGAAQEALCGYDPLPGDGSEPVPAMTGPAGEETEEGADTPAGSAGTSGAEAWHGPRSALEAERARQNRITVVGAVTERWAPEQAHAVHEKWRLSPPVGPPADLWALGALLFRSVQGHPPYPEENAAELVQMVCSEPPAFAEECGALRPLVESLLRPDPEERPEAEELGGWLRSLIRSAPEPDLGEHTVYVPADPAKLPVKRRKGELVRRRRREAGETGGLQHRRHARGKQAKAARTVRPPRPARRERAPRAEEEHFLHEQVVSSRRPASDGAASPRRLGLGLLVVLLALLVVAAVAVVLLMPHRDTSSGGSNGDRTVPARMPGSHSGSGPGGSDGSEGGKTPSASPSHTAAPPPSAPATTAAPPPSAPPDLGPDFALRADPAGFTVAVHTGWQRAGKNGRGQVRYTGSDLTMTVVPGRDKATGDAQDPLAYQLVEPELADFRASSWSSASGLQTLTVHGHEAAEGEYTWRDANQQSVYARNLAIRIGGRYHVVLVYGPDAQRAAVQRAFDKVVETYTAG
jgi:serine/threonine protein kinase